MNEQNFNNGQGFNNQNFNQTANVNPTTITPPPVGPKTAEGIQKAYSSKTLGILSIIVGLLCCRIASIVLGVIAISYASTSTEILGFEHPDAKTGKGCGIAGLVIAAVTLVLSLTYGIIMALIALAEKQII